MTTPTYLQSPPDHRPFSNQLDLDVTETISYLLPGLIPGATTRLRVYPVWDRAKMWQIFNWEMTYENYEQSLEFDTYLKKLDSILGTVKLADDSLQYWVELAPGIKALFYQSSSRNHA
jgi:hypothetical protein